MSEYRSNVEKTLLRIGIFNMALAIFVTLMFVMAFIPNSMLPSMSKKFEIAGHVVGFTVFAVLYYFSKIPPNPNRTGMIETALNTLWICLVFGAGTEFCQSVLTSTREGEMIDLTADTIGGLIGIAVAVAIHLGVSRYADTTRTRA